MEKSNIIGESLYEPIHGFISVDEIFDSDREGSHCDICLRESEFGEYGRAESNCILV